MNRQFFAPPPLHQKNSRTRKINLSKFLFFFLLSLSFLHAGIKRIITSSIKQLYGMLERNCPFTLLLLSAPMPERSWTDTEALLCYRDSLADSVYAAHINTKRPEGVEGPIENFGKRFGYYRFSLHTVSAFFGRTLRQQCLGSVYCWCYCNWRCI